MSLRLCAVSAMLAALAAAPGTADARRAPPGASPEAAELYRHTPVIELVTMGVGSLIWERHGHIALCVRYEDPTQDACYNYGVGSFHEPVQMGWGFFRGTHSFWVAKMNPRAMLGIYHRADRSIWVQPLPLTDEQKQKVIDRLEHDILPENKYYAYDHFFDNCTTRVRDVIDEATGGALSSMNEKTDGRTYRDLAREGFFGMRIPLLITDVAMGPITDRVPTYYQRMFLPQYMREAAQTKWGIAPIEVYTRKGPPPQHDGPSGRLLFALLVIVLTAPAWATRLFGRFERIGMAFAVLPPVILGTVLWFLAIISPLPYVRYNETCLVFMPFDLLLIAFLSPARRRIYARVRVGILVLTSMLIVVGALTQPLLAPILWPLIPAAVVGFWPDAWRKS